VVRFERRGEGDAVGSQEVDLDHRAPRIGGGGATGELVGHGHGPLAERRLVAEVTAQARLAEQHQRHPEEQDARVFLVHRPSSRISTVVDSKTTRRLRAAAGTAGA
jgi:hypothetical protein